MFYLWHIRRLSIRAYLFITPRRSFNPFQRPTQQSSSMPMLAKKIQTVFADTTTATTTTKETGDKLSLLLSSAQLSSARDLLRFTIYEKYVYHG